MFIIKQSLFGKIDSNEIIEYELKNTNGTSVSILNYGATITKFFTKDKYNLFKDIVLGFTKLEGYLHTTNRYFGSTIGRVANRISNSKFYLENEIYRLNTNNNNATLHGGIKGFDKVIWDTTLNNENNSITFDYISADREEGFPGNLSININFRLTEYDELIINYKANTDKKTHVNLTNHTYFNLSSKENSTIHNHLLEIKAESYLEVDQNLIPTGKFLNVSNTNMDFRELRMINQDSNDINFDHNWVLDKEKDKLEKIAKLVDKESGRELIIYTTMPGLQFYAGNKINPSLEFTKSLKGYNKNSGLCLETQFFPDTPNNITFPSSILEPEIEYNHTTIYKFQTVNF